MIGGTTSGTSRCMTNQRFSGWCRLSHHDFAPRPETYKIERTHQEQCSPSGPTSCSLLIFGLHTTVQQEHYLWLQNPLSALQRCGPTKAIHCRLQLSTTRMSDNPGGSCEPCKKRKRKVGNTKAILSEPKTFPSKRRCPLVVRPWIVRMSNMTTFRWMSADLLQANLRTM